MMMYMITFAACISAVAAGNPWYAWGRLHGNSYTVSTTNGLITGHQAPNRTSVIEYLGIPYAKPPLGELRFAPPERFNLSDPYEALNWGFDCPLTVSPPVDFPGLTPQAKRIMAYFASGANNSQSEDCLTLNIWTKPSRKYFSSKKAVLVFIYGGRFTNGNTNTPFYNGQYFVDAQDVVVVTVNYRTNIFGFPGAPGIKSNLGLRDQRLAVEWLYDNVDKFGGDKSKITLFGQSSGGVAVDWWSYAYQEDPLVHGLIPESGNAFSFPLNEPNVTTTNWYNVTDRLGCGASDDTLACMRQVDWKDIKSAAAKVKSAPSGSRLRSIPPFYPAVDDEIVFADYVQRARQGRFAKVPYLLGNNHNEQGYYIISAYGNGINATQAEGQKFLLESFTCPNSFEAKNRHAQGVPVWLYRYFGDWDNTRLYPTSGAYHGAELQMLFGASEDVSGIPPSAAQMETTSVMQRAWATFADDPAYGLERQLGWPQYDDNSQSLVRLAFDNSPVPDFVSPSLYDESCSATP